jgi:hypothetical protein
VPASKLAGRNADQERRFKDAVALRRGDEGWRITLPPYLGESRSGDVFASTVQDLSTLRPDDSVTVTGRIREVSQCDRTLLEKVRRLAQ